MRFETKNYELHIIKYAIERGLDRLLPKDSQEAVVAIACQRDEIIWRIATEIYTKL